jgi:hypothetical protein
MILKDLQDVQVHEQQFLLLGKLPLLLHCQRPMRDKRGEGGENKKIER